MRCYSEVITQQPQEQQKKPLIIFDGVCVLCSWAMRLLLFADRNKQIFDFATTQSDLGKRILSENNFSTDDFETVLLVTSEGKIHTKMNVVLESATRLGGVWNALYIFKVLPQKQRDALYDFVATRRYKWFGKNEYCKRIPPQYLNRIIQ